MAWLSRVSSESKKLSTHFESLVCKLESLSSQVKFHIFPVFFLLRITAQHTIKWCPTSYKMVPIVVLSSLNAGYSF